MLSHSGQRMGRRVILASTSIPPYFGAAQRAHGWTGSDVSKPSSWQPRLHCTWVFFPVFCLIILTTWQALEFPPVLACFSRIGSEIAWPFSLEISGTGGRCAPFSWKCVQIDNIVHQRGSPFVLLRFGLSLTLLREMFPFKSYLSVSFKTSSYFWGIVEINNVTGFIKDIWKAHLWRNLEFSLCVYTIKAVFQQFRPYLNRL